VLEVPFGKFKSFHALFKIKIKLIKNKKVSQKFLTGHGLRIGCGAGFTIDLPQLQMSPIGLNAGAGFPGSVYSLQIVLTRGFALICGGLRGKGLGALSPFLQLHTSVPSPIQLQSLKVAEI
jgi:hypothetical protein